MINRFCYYSAQLLLLLGIMACGNGNDIADAYGNFESEEIIVSSQSTGELINFYVEDGDEIAEGMFAGITDTVPVSLQLDQLCAQMKTLAAKKINIQAQEEVQREQLKNLERETRRIENLYKQQAATEQQYEDLLGKLNVTKAQLKSVETQYQAVNAENEVLVSQMRLLENQLQKCKIINPVKGRVLETYVNKGELVTAGKALYKIANLDEMELKVYVSGSQLAGIKIGDNVKVMIDKAKNEPGEYQGTVSWISSETEFTPKIIQTREERVNMVYGIRIKVKNDGSIKIGMPGEVVFSKPSAL
ncbi:MAG: HlyD family efflux transporter periplasmic adaptor subunit [Bacteroidales bacterium]|nr:HlyD family efflux transporter periplasmic adaptor subunit [Bacteroidales bacterium]